MTLTFGAVWSSGTLPTEVNVVSRRAKLWKPSAARRREAPGRAVDGEERRLAVALAFGHHRDDVAPCRSSRALNATGSPSPNSVGVSSGLSAIVVVPRASSRR